MYKRRCQASQSTRVAQVDRLLRAMKRLAIPAASLGVAAIALLFSAETTAPSKSGFDPDRLARIPGGMKALIDRGEVAGTVELIQRHGSIVFLHASGYQDIEAGKPMKTDSIFQIMSMTKPLTGV